MCNSCFLLLFWKVSPRGLRLRCEATAQRCWLGKSRPRDLGLREDSYRSFLFVQQGWMNEAGRKCSCSRHKNRGLLSSTETLISYQEALRFMLASEAQSWWWWLSSSFPILLIYVRHPSSLLVSVISTTHKGYQTYQHHSFSPRLQDLIWKCLFLGPGLWFFTWERFLVISLLDCRCLAQCSFGSPK